MVHMGRMRAGAGCVTEFEIRFGFEMPGVGHIAPRSFSCVMCAAGSVLCAYLKRRVSRVGLQKKYTESIEAEKYHGEYWCTD